MLSNTFRDFHGRATLFACHSPSPFQVCVCIRRRIIVKSFSRPGRRAHYAPSKTSAINILDAQKRGFFTYSTAAYNTYIQMCTHNTPAGKYTVTWYGTTDRRYIMSVRSVRRPRWLTVETTCAAIYEYVHV